MIGSNIKSSSKRPQRITTTSLPPESRNIDEGSFVDIGVKQDGLIHVSKLKNRALSVGQVIEVEVLEIDEQRGRILLGLSAPFVELSSYLLLDA